MNKTFLLVLGLGLGAVYYTQQLPSPADVSKPAPVATRTLYLFTKSGCAPCARLKKELDDPILREKIAPWRIEEVSSSLRARRHKVGAFPTLVAEKGGTELGRKEGYQSKSAIMDWLDSFDRAGATVGGPVHPDGTEVVCHLPGDQHCKNVSSRGEGCCTQTSVNHAARFQNVPALIDFHKWVQEKGLSGGGSPGTMRDRIPRCCKDRGYPVVPFIQVENASHDVLKAAIRTGRMVSCTYSKSPTGRYDGRRIAHMVNCVHADDKHVVILDNNYVGDDKLEWLTLDEAKKAGVYEWIVVLLNPPPPPTPISGK